MEFLKLASNLDLKFEDFLYAEKISSDQLHSSPTGRADSTA